MFTVRKAEKVKKVEETIGLLQKNFECPICLELMSNAVGTKCDHKFCSHCIHEAIGKKTSAPCPLCKKPFTRRSLQKLVKWNQIVNKVKELVSAFQRDTGVGFSPGHGGRLPPSPLVRGKKNLADDEEVNNKVEKKNENSKTRSNSRRGKKRSSDDPDPLVFMDVEDGEKSQTSSSVKTNLNVSSGFPIKRALKRKKISGNKVYLSGQENNHENCDISPNLAVTPVLGEAEKGTKKTCTSTKKKNMAINQQRLKKDANIDVGMIDSTVNEPEINHSSVNKATKLDIGKSSPKRIPEIMQNEEYLGLNECQDGRSLKMKTPKSAEKVQKWLQTVPSSLSSVNSKNMTPSGSLVTPEPSPVVSVGCRYSDSGESDNEGGMYIHYRDEEEGEEEDIKEDEPNLVENICRPGSQRSMEALANTVFPPSSSAKESSAKENMNCLLAPQFQRKRIFKTRVTDGSSTTSNVTDTIPDRENPDDPYAFKVSQKTPKQNKRKGRRKKIDVPVVVFEDPKDTIRSLKEEKEVLSPLSRLVNETPKLRTKKSRSLLKKIKAVVDEPDSAEVKALTEIIAEAEDFDLMMSQQFRDMQKEETAKRPPKSSEGAVNKLLLTPDQMSSMKSKWKKPAPPKWESDDQEQLSESTKSCEKKADDKIKTTMETGPAGKVFQKTFEKKRVSSGGKKTLLPKKSPRASSDSDQVYKDEESKAVEKETLQLNLKDEESDINEKDVISIEGEEVVPAILETSCEQKLIAHTIHKDSDEARDSDDTDEIEMECSQICYEEPDLDIQPKDIKEKLSQMTASFNLSLEQAAKSLVTECTSETGVLQPTVDIQSMPTVKVGTGVNEPILEITSQNQGSLDTVPDIIPDSVVLSCKSSSSLKSKPGKKISKSSRSEPQANRRSAVHAASSQGKEVEQSLDVPSTSDTTSSETTSSLKLTVGKKNPADVDKHAGSRNAGISGAVCEQIAKNAAALIVSQVFGESAGSERWADYTTTSQSATAKFNGEKSTQSTQDAVSATPNASLETVPMAFPIPHDNFNASQIKSSKQKRAKRSKQTCLSKDKDVSIVSDSIADPEIGSLEKEESVLNSDLMQSELQNSENSTSLLNNGLSKTNKGRMKQTNVPQTTILNDRCSQMEESEQSPPRRRSGVRGVRGLASKLNADKLIHLPCGFPAVRSQRISDKAASVTTVPDTLSDVENEKNSPTDKTKAIEIEDGLPDIILTEMDSNDTDTIDVRVNLSDTSSEEGKSTDQEYYKDQKPKPATKRMRFNRNKHLPVDDADLPDRQTLSTDVNTAVDTEMSESLLKAPLDDQKSGDGAENMHIKEEPDLVQVLEAKAVASGKTILALATTPQKPVYVEDRETDEAEDMRKIMESIQKARLLTGDKLEDPISPICTPTDNEQDPPVQVVSPAPDIEQDDDLVIVSSPVQSESSQKVSISSDDSFETMENNEKFCKNTALEKRHTLKKAKPLEPNDKDSTDEEEVNVCSEKKKKRRKRMIIEDDSYEGDSDATMDSHANLTSSSAFSSQSDPLNSESKEHLQNEVEAMAEEIALLEAQIADGHKAESPATCKSSSIWKSEASQGDETNGIIQDSCNKQEAEVAREGTDKDRSMGNGIDRGMDEYIEDNAENSDEDIFGPSQPETENNLDSLGSHYKHLIGSVFKKGKSLTHVKKIDLKDDTERKNTSQEKSDDFVPTPRSPSPPPPLNLEQFKTAKDIVWPKECEALEKVQHLGRKSPQPSSSKNTKHEQNSKINLSINKYGDNNRTPLEKICTNSEAVIIKEEEEEWPQRSHWSFTASSISKVCHMPYIEKLALKLGCRVSPRYSEQTTHVIVKPASEGSRICHRTLKYFQGVAGHKWLISVQWAIDCIKNNKLLPMESYEIFGDTLLDDNHYGPLRSRTSHNIPFLQNYEICCMGQYTDLTVDDLRGLVQACGATSVSSPNMFSFNPKFIQLILVQSCEDGRTLNQMKALFKKYQAPILIKEWLLDSIGVFGIQDYTDYRVWPPSEQSQKS